MPCIPVFLEDPVCKFINERKVSCCRWGREGSSSGYGGVEKMSIRAGHIFGWVARGNLWVGGWNGSSFADIQACEMLGPGYCSECVRK